MRAILLSILVIAIPVTTLADEPCERLELKDLLRIVKQFQELERFADNEFLYEEKVTRLVNELSEKHEGAPVTLPLEVKYISKQNVTGKLPEGVDDVPFIALFTDKLDLEKVDLTGSEVSWATLTNASELVGVNSRHGKFERDVHLEVGPLVKVDVAKRLRAGDHMHVHGTVKKIAAVETVDDDLVDIVLLIENSKVEVAK